MRALIISRILEYTCNGEYLDECEIAIDNDITADNLGDLEKLSDIELLDLFQEIVGFNG